MRTIILILTLALSATCSNPCQRLCDLDGHNVCTNGSYPRNGGICHAYFRMPNNGHCYHTTTTQHTCPASLPPLTVQEAEAIVASSEGRADRLGESFTSVDTETLILPTSDESSDIGNYRVDSGATAEDEAPDNDPINYRNIIVSFETLAAAADFIGNSYTENFDNIRNMIDSMAMALSHPVVSRSTSPRVSLVDAMDFWDRARGAELLSRARAANDCANTSQLTICAPLMLLLGHMPFPVQSSSRQFLEQIGAYDFLTINAGSLRDRLRSSINFYLHLMGSTHRSLPETAFYMVRNFARHWPARFPMIIGDSIDLIAMSLRHYIETYDWINNPSQVRGSYSLSLYIRRDSPLVSSGVAFEQYSPISFRQGITSVAYADEWAQGSGLIPEYFSIMASSVIGSGPNPLFTTDNVSGYEKMIQGISNLDLYRTLGKFFALSIINRYPTGIRLPPAFFSMLLGQPVTLDDVRVFDEAWAQTAQMYMNARNEEELLSFSLGEPEPFPGSGAHEPVTMANRGEQAQMAINNIISNNCPEQFNAIAEGFFGILPREMFAGFQGRHLQAILVGNTDISADELIAHMTMHLPREEQGRWLHQIIRDFTPQMRQRFLRFVTGLSIVPNRGWTEFGQLTVYAGGRVSDGEFALPRAQTCFRFMVLPEYDSLEQMRVRMFSIMHLRVVCPDSEFRQTLVNDFCK